MLLNGQPSDELIKIMSGRSHNRTNGHTATTTTTTKGHAKQDTTAKQNKENGTAKSEFKDGDTVLFNVRTADIAVLGPAIALGDGLYKKPK